MTMHHHVACRYLTLGLSAAALGVLAVPVTSPVEAAPAPATVSPHADTEDIVYMNDGRELHGRVVSEDAQTVVFEIIDRELGLSTEIRLYRNQIYKIERNVAIAGSATETTETSTTEGEAAGAASETASPEEEENYDPSIPSLYIVPLVGQLGTDIYHEVYEPIIDDIIEKNPTCIVFAMECDATQWKDFTELEEYRILVTNFRNRLPRDIRQVMWIDNSVGTSSVIALSWAEIYMKPDARLDGLDWVHTNTAGWQDADVRAKMQAAFSGIAKGFLEFGGHDLELGEAMMFPQHSLSATFRGRKVDWALHEEGEVIADHDDEATVGFNAEDARNLLISTETVDGNYDTATGLDDLAFILGYREYRRANGMAEDYLKEYREDWREAFEIASRRLQDFQEARARADLASNAEARQAIGEVARYMSKYYAVERMIGRDFGLQLYQIEVILKGLQEQARQLREREQGRDRGRGNGGGGPGIPGGGG